MKTAVVILNYNGKHFLEKFLRILIDYTPSTDASIFVADNASTDDSLSFLKQHYPEITIITLAENFGFAGGYNKALQSIDAEYYVLVNSDVEVSKGWLTPVVNYMDNESKVVACQPKILSYHNRTKFEYAGAAGGFLDKYGYPFCRGRMMGVCETDRGQYDSIEEIFWASGACLFIRKKAFWDVGGFDESFFAHMEEIDLCWRLKARGGKIKCIPQSLVYHVGGGTLDAENPKKTYLNYRNNLVMIYKNMPNEHLNKVLFLRFFLDYLSALVLVFSGKKENAKSVYKARRDFKKQIKNYRLKRKENLEKASSESPVGLINKSVVYAFYVQNKKHFSRFIS